MCSNHKTKQAFKISPLIEVFLLDIYKAKDFIYLIGIQSLQFYFFSINIHAWFYFLLVWNMKNPVFLEIFIVSMSASQPNL